MGLIYGPSGCGKSSLVKAGLLPRLAQARPAGLRRGDPGGDGSPAAEGLAQGVSRPAAASWVWSMSLAALRQGRVLPSGQKVLLVLDQFEQWLHAKRSEENTELVAALRQCDGEHVQAIVMVRDDFWMAVTRFMRDLEIRLVEGQNIAARRSLRPSPCPQGAGGVRPGLRQLAREDAATSPRTRTRSSIKPSPAWPRKARSSRCGWPCSPRWSRASPGRRRRLREVGGTEGVGVTFLEETFSASHGHSRASLHQKAAQAVLKALLPETGTDIKGQMRSDAELLEASGYAEPSQGLRRPAPHPRRRAPPDHADRPRRLERRARRRPRRAGSTTNSPTTTWSTRCGTG